MMPKRITYLEKRDGLTREEFSKHWSTVHADIARALPGVIAYRQNHLYDAALDGTRAGGFAIDGIVELWFADDSVVGAGFNSDVADRLAADEVNFLSGLTGGAVYAAEPYQPCSTKLWVLGRWGGNSSSAEANVVADWANSQAGKWPGAVHSSVNVLDLEAPLLTREALKSDPRMAQIAVAFSFKDKEAASEAFDGVLPSVDSALHGVLVGARAYLGEERVII